MEAFSQAMLLDKYLVQYYKCPVCGFVRTEKPYWLEEAYSNAIVNFDMGLLNRNIYLSKIVSAIIQTCFKNRDTFLDYGGGYGIFVRLMRDRGFDFHWYDKYCVNLFAKGFEKSKDKYDIVTAFELAEHLIDPKEEIGNIINISSTFVFTTELLPIKTPKPNEWWYYALKGGQHISFYTKKSLEILADEYDKYYIGMGGLHIFSDKKICKPYFLFVYKLFYLYNYINKRKSLLNEDYTQITGEKL